jgi:MFS family permease
MSEMALPHANRPSPDFWKFWAGQTISNLGTSVTLFALPLLIFKLTGSALNLGLMSAAEMTPYLLFGLILGAWVDRVDRRRLMISADIGRAALIASIPLMAEFGELRTWWIYVVGFLLATLTICFDSSQFAAIPSLVETDDLVTANGRIQASFAAAWVVGPLLGGTLIAWTSLEAVFYIDAISFILSACSLGLIRRQFNAPPDESTSSTSLRQDIAEGLRYVLGHPILRNISIMMAMINFVGASITAQLVLFAHDQLGATDKQTAWLYAANALGVVACSISAGALRKRWSFSTVALGALIISGALTVVFALMTSYWLAMPVIALSFGFGTLFNINTASLRQAIVPNHMLGRVVSIASVLAFSAIPLGALVGGFAIERFGNVAVIFAIIGLLQVVIAFAFSRTALGHAERYIPAAAGSGNQSSETPQAESRKIRQAQGHADPSPSANS